LRPPFTRIPIACKGKGLSGTMVDYGYVAEGNAAGTPFLAMCR
jgi:hypothetical protein